MARTPLLLVLPLGALVVGIWAGVFVAQNPPYLGIELLGNGNVHHVDPQGPAGRVGLKVGDLVVAVDHRPLHARHSLYGGKSPGEGVVLTVLRDGARVQIETTLGSVTRGEYIFRIERLFLGLIFWLVGVAGWLLRPAQQSAQLFLVFSQVAAAILFGEILDPTVPAMSALTDLLRNLVAPLLLHFFATFPRPLSNPTRNILLKVAYAGYGVVAILFAGAIFFQLDLYASGMWIAPRIFEVVVLVVALIVLLRPQPTASLDTLRRRRLLIAGMLIGITPIVITLTSMVLTEGPPLVTYEWTLPALALVPLAYGYAVYKGELGHADLILNRSIVYVLLTVFLLGIYALLYFAINKSLSAERGWEHLLSGVLLVLGGSALFVPLRTRLQHRVDRLFYGGWYDYRSFVQSVSADLSRSTDLSLLTTQLQTAAETMRFQGGTMLWRRGDDFYPIGSYGFSRTLLPRFRLPADAPILQHLQDGEGPYSHRELREALSDADVSENERHLLNGSAITYWLPLVCRGTLRSILVTGPRQGDEELDREDRSILATMSTQAAIACENIALLQSVQERLAEVERVKDELAEAQARLTEGREDERLRLARELHDGPVQDLYSIMHELEGLATDAVLSKGIPPVRETAQRVAETLRAVCVELRPPLLADFGLDVAIRSYAARFMDNHPEIEIELNLMPRGQELPERVQLALFRICQQGLNNAAQHGKARHIRVRFEADAEQIRLEVVDDGVGFVVPERWIELGRRGHLGLLGIAERAKAVGGTLEVLSTPGEGTTLRVIAPLPEDSPSGPSGPSRHQPFLNHSV